MSDNLHQKRLYWHSRRGMLELDLILVPFFESCFEDLAEQDKLAYERLIAEEDQDLFKWLLGRELPEDESLRDIVSRIITHAKTPKD